MKSDQRRRLFAQMQLMLFVLMLLISSLHHHDCVVSGEEVCYNCVNHLPHNGHFSGSYVSLHDCFLCQIASASFVVPVLLAVPLYAFVRRVQSFFAVAPLCLGSTKRQNTRAPPAFSLS